MAATPKGSPLPPTGASSSNSQPNPFEKELVRFKDQLNNKEKEYFQFSTEDEFTKEIDVLQTKLHAGRRQQNMTKLAGFIEAMNQFGKVIDVYCQTSEIVAFVWGPWKLFLTIAETISSAFTELLNTYEQLGDTMLLLLQARKEFPNDPHMATILSRIYRDILNFHRQAFKYFQQPMLKQLFQATWKTYKTRFSDLIEAMSHHRLLLLGQTTLSEARRLREAEESRVIEQQAERDLRIRRELYNWLQGANMKNDHRHFQQIRSKTPNSGHWLFSKDEFRKWFDRFPSIPALLWINGIPGAGKTILSSLVVDEAKTLAHKPIVVYFYCKTNHPDRDNFIAIGRSLLLQLLEQNPDIMHYLYDKYKQSTDATLATVADIEGLLETALKNMPNVYIILDGIDECPRDERKSISHWFRKLVEDLPKKNPDQVRCLFVSQDDGPARKDFSDIASIKIKPGDNREDITRFGDTWAVKLQERFELSDEKRDSIARRIVESSEGMFLLAKLICENLFQQATFQDLEAELEPHTFPKEINDAYDRIMIRIANQAPFSTKNKYCLMLLGWLVCSKRPLKWHEIQTAKSIYLEEQTVDMQGHQFRDHPKDICGSMIEEHDGVIDLVHLTAKLFLVEKKYIDPVAEELKLAALCVNYLNLPGFRVPLTGIEDLAVTGYYTFMEYAALYWVRHLESGLASLTPNEHPLNDLAESLDCFLDLHWAGASSALVAPIRIQQRLQQFKNFPFFEKLLQAVVSTRKHLTQLGEMKQDEIVLDVFDVLLDVRDSIEDLSLCSDNQSTQNSIVGKHGPGIFKCSRPSCHHFSVGFITADERKLHVEKHIRPFRCSEVGCPTFEIGLTTARDLEKHMHEVHGHTFRGDMSLEFPTEDELLGREVATDDDSEATSRQAIQRPKKRLKKTKHVCPTCSKTFSKLFNMTSHMHSHSNDRQYTCDHLKDEVRCGKTFKRRSDLTRHLKSHREGEHRCGGTTSDGRTWGCDRTFARADILKSHLNRDSSCRPCI